MAHPDQRSSRRRTVIVLAGLVLLIALILATCRRKVPVAPDQAPVATAPLPAAGLPGVKLRAGLEVISPDPAAALIVVRDRASGQTVQIPRAEFSPQAVDRAFARLIVAPPVPAAPPASPAAAAVGKEGPPVATGPVPAGRADPGAGGAAPKPAAIPVSRPLVEEKLPDFIPLYPGAATIKIASSRERGRWRGDYEFSTPDSPDEIGKFYAKGAAAAGLTIIVNVAGTNAKGPTFTLIAEDAAAEKSLSLTAGWEAGKCRGSIEFVAR